ncbi:MAG: hypothetical protein OEM91_10750 [Hyphomicrobiales bacterium]|nr:hypothetical protein [Hyphomicrobiales bacterium]
MILDTLLRWVWIAVAFCLAAFVAIVVLFSLGTLWAGEELREVAETRGDWILWHGSDAFGALFFTSAVLPALTALPGLIAIIAGELFHIRSLVYYTAAGGVALIAVPLLAGAPQEMNQPAIPAADYMTLFATAGFAAGFFYWLIAGRKA